MRLLLHLFYLPLIVCNHGIAASESNDKLTRSIETNSKSNDQPFRVNLTCKLHENIDISPTKLVGK